MKQVVERLVTFEHWVLVVAGGGGCGNELIGWWKHHGASCGLFLFLFSLGYIDNSKFRNYE